MFRLFCTHNGPLEGQSEVETGAIPLGKPAAERIRARGDRSARAQLADDRGEPARGPSPGKGARWCGWRASIPSCCSPLQHRSTKAQADCDLNPDASGNGAGANGAAQRSVQPGRILRGTPAQLQCARPESRESRGDEPRTRSRTAAIVRGNRVVN